MGVSNDAPRSRTSNEIMQVPSQDTSQQKEGDQAGLLVS